MEKKRFIIFAHTQKHLTCGYRNCGWAAMRGTCDCMTGWLYWSMVPILLNMSLLNNFWWYCMSNAWCCGLRLAGWADKIGCVLQDKGYLFIFIICRFCYFSANDILVMKSYG